MVKGVHLAPSVDLVEVVLAKQPVNRKRIAQRRAHCVVVHLLLVVLRRLNFILREQYVSHEHCEDEANGPVAVEVVLDWLDFVPVGAVESRWEEVLEELREEFFHHDSGELLALEGEGALPLEGVIFY